MTENNTEQLSNQSELESKLKTMLFESRKYRSNGTYTEATKLLEQVRRLAFENELTTYEIDALEEMGNALTHTDPDSAFLQYQAALNLAQLLGDNVRTASLFGALANLHRVQGRVSEAKECFQAALDIYRDDQDAQGLFLLSANLAGFYYELNQPVEGEKYVVKAIELARKYNNINGEAMSLCSYAKGLQQVRKFDQALDIIQQAIIVAEKSGNASIIATALECNGYIHQMLYDYKSAIECYQQALEMFQKQNNIRMVASILSNLGFCHQNRQDDATALAYLKQALQLSREIGERRTESLILRAMAGSFTRMGDFEKAYHLLHEALEIMRTSGNVRNQAVVLAGLAEVMYALGNKAEAFQTMEQAVDLLRNGPTDAKLIQVMISNAELLRNDGRIDQAERIEAEIKELKATHS